jgi:hypothetical protein
MLQERTAQFMRQKEKNLQSILRKNKALIETVPNVIAVQSVKDQLLQTRKNIMVR